MLLRVAAMSVAFSAVSGLQLIVGGVSGTQGAVFALDEASGAMRLTLSSSLFGASPAYMALSADRSVLYVTNHGVGEGLSGVTSLALTWNGSSIASISFLGFASCDDPAHVALHPSGAWAMTASYSAGTVSLFSVDSARALKLITTIPAGAKAHQVVFSAAGGSCVFVPCLGADAVAQFTLDPASGALTPLAMAPFVSLPAGSGPRHMVISPDGRRAWVLCELSSQLFEFEFDVGGSLVPVAGVPPVNTTRTGRPTADVQAAAAIVLSDDVKFIYVSNRASPAGTGDNSVLALAVGAPGTPASPLAWADANGTLAFPRDIALLRNAGNSLLVAANQHSNSLTVFARSATTGLLTTLGAGALSAPVSGPSFVLPLVPQ